MACSQKRRCHIPRSDFTCLLVEIRSPGSIALEKTDLIKRQRVEKSQSPDGNVHKLGNRSGALTDFANLGGERTGELLV